MMAVPISTEPTFSAGSPTALFDAQNFSFGRARTYDHAPDGRFLMIALAVADPSLVVVENWTEELQRLVPID